MLMPIDMPAVVRQAFERAPSHLFCCDDFDHGVYRKNKYVALTRRHVQIDKAGYCSVILLDVDRRGATDAPADAGLPPPSWVCMNPANGHAHIAYVLEEPIRRTSADDRPARFLRAVRQGMVRMIQADTNYNGRLTKNPLSSAWVTTVVNKTYSLSELAEYIPDDLLSIPARRAFTSQREEVLAPVGRNAALFDAVRQAHYPAWSSLVSMPASQSVAKLFDAAVRMNGERIDVAPLSEHELMTICRSIDRFLRSRYRKPKDSEAFSLRQGRRQKLAAQKRRLNNQQRLIVAASSLVGSGRPLTFASLARESGLTRQTVASTHREHSLALMADAKRLSGESVAKRL